MDPTPQKFSFEDAISTEEVVEHEDEFTLFSQEEFLKNFDNFFTIFTATPGVVETLTKIRQFLEVLFPKEFKELEHEFKEKSSPEEVVKENKDILYKIYLALREKDKFSNIDLQLKTWRKKKED